MIKILEESENRLVTFESGRSWAFLSAFAVFVSLIFLKQNLEQSPIDYRWTAVAVFCVVFFAFSIFRLSSTTIEIDKQTKTLTITVKRLLGHSVRVIPFADVDSVEARRAWTRAITDQKTHQTPQLLSSSSVVILKSGEEVYLALPSGTSGLNNNEQGTTVAVSRKVADYIGVPYMNIAPGDNPTGGMIIN